MTVLLHCVPCTTVHCKCNSTNTVFFNTECILSLCHCKCNTNTVSCMHCNYVHIVTHCIVNCLQPWPSKVWNMTTSLFIWSRMVEFRSVSIYKAKQLLHFIINLLCTCGFKLFMCTCMKFCKGR